MGYRNLIYEIDGWTEGKYRRMHGDMFPVAAQGSAIRLHDHDVVRFIDDQLYVNQLRIGFVFSFEIGREHTDGQNDSVSAVPAGAAT